MAATIQEGARFANYDEFLAAIKALQKSEGIKLVKQDTKTVEAANRKLKNKFSSDSKYAYVRYVCKHYGQRRKSESTGVQPNQGSSKSGCEYQIYGCLDKATNEFVVQKFVSEHNHDVPSGTSEKSPKRRRLTSSETQDQGTTQRNQAPNWGMPVLPLALIDGKNKEHGQLNAELQEPWCQLQSGEGDITAVLHHNIIAQSASERFLGLQRAEHQHIQDVHQRATQRNEAPDSGMPVLPQVLIDEKNKERGQLNAELQEPWCQLQSGDGDITAVLHHNIIAKPARESFLGPQGAEHQHIQEVDQGATQRDEAPDSGMPVWPQALIDEKNKEIDQLKAELQELRRQLQKGEGDIIAVLPHNIAAQSASTSFHQLQGAEHQQRQDLMDYSNDHQPGQQDGTEMTQQHKDVIERKKSYLLDNMTVTGMFLALLVVWHIIDEDEQKELLQEGLTKMRQVGRFCEIIVRKGSKAFDSFMRALVDTNQEHVRDEILKDLLLCESASPNNSAAEGTENAQDTDVNIRGASDEKTAEKTRANTEAMDKFWSSESGGMLRIKMGMYGLTATQVAVKEGDVNLLSNLIKLGEDVNVVDEDRQNLLHRAAREGQTDVIDFLLNETKSLSVNSIDEEHQTPLHVSIMSGNPATSRHLIECQADINMVDTLNRDPLYLACQFGDLDTARILLDKGAVYTTKTSLSITALDAACFDGHIDVARLLLGRGADVNVCRDNGCTPLHVACWKGHAAVAELLVSRGAQVDARVTGGTTPLHVACQEGHVAVAELLVSRGAQVDARETDGATPLYVACWKGHAAVAELLVSRGAQVDARETDGRTPLHVACQEGHAAVAELLLSRGAQVDARKTTGATPLYIACQNGHAAVAELLVSRGAQVDARDTEGATPLFIACQQGHSEVVERLLAWRAEVDGRCAGCRNSTPLHVACHQGQHSVVRLLLEKGADINARDKYDETPLHLACREGQTRTVRELLQHPTLNTRIVNKYNQTARDLAEARGHKEILEMLPSDTTQPHWFEMLFSK